jgi:flagellar hook protein FlgE
VSLSKFGVQVANAYPATGTVIGADEANFTSQSVDGGAVTGYDSQGNPVDVNFRWAEISSSASGGSNTWQLFYQTNPSATGTQTAWQSVGTNFTFDSAGQLSPPITSVTIPNLTVSGDSLGNVAVNFATNALTQYASTSGTSQVGSLQQNGFAAGTLESISVNTKGQVVGSFSNGQTISLADITLATFNGENSLQALNGEAYAATPESGNPTYGATGTITGSSLESSNVDIATQFSDLIVAQQAYGANAKVMSTADQMIQSLLQVIQ